MYERFRASLAHRVAFIVATGLGSGLLRVAPGTWGSLVGIFVVSLVWTFSTVALCVFWSAVFVVGTWATRVFQRTTGFSDPGQIVIDEVLGMGVAALFCRELSELPYAFVLFRFFDVLKPPPLRWVDRLSKRRGGWLSAVAVQLDDVGAALFTGAVLWVLRTHTSVLNFFS